MKNEDIKTLKKIGLTTYESNAYLTLASLITATATEISNASNIPRSKIYDVLKNLANKGFIEIENGRPLKYNIKPPITTIKKQKEELNTELDKLATKLNFIYENEIKQVPAPVWKISGMENIIQKELDIIKKSKNTISMRIGFIFKDELELIIKELKKKEDTININILVSPKCNITEILRKEGFNTYETNIPSVKIIINEGKEIFHVYTRFSEDKQEIIPDSAIGVWNQYEDIANSYETNFKKQLKKIKENYENTN